MRELVPFGGLGGLRREVERLFDRFFDGEVLELGELGAWSPKIEVSENKDKVIVKAEVPGIEAKEIEVSAEDPRRLTIKGEKKQEKEEKGEHHYRSERTYGAFSRTIFLPAPVDAAKAEASFKNGVVTITLPKAAGAAGKAIPVKTAA
jgi:HSP20 family protein